MIERTLLDLTKTYCHCHARLNVYVYIWISKTKAAELNYTLGILSIHGDASSN